MEKKLYRSRENAMLAGVCGGVAEYFNLDPTLVRLLWVLAMFLGFSGGFAYLICLIIIPQKPLDY